MTASRTIAKQSALDGVRVLDLTRFYSGPFATLILAGFGAEVIRIDRPGQGDPTMTGPPFLGKEGVSLERRHETDLGLAYLKRCRGKKSVSLDMRTPEGMELFHSLLSRSDILIENWRPGAAKALRVDYEANRRVNPKLIHCALTGYGSTGQDRGLKGYDLMIQAACGLMSITGNPGDAPSKAGSALADGIAGAFAVSGILAALVEQRLSGQGQFVDVSMADCLLSLVLDEPLDCYERLGMETRQGNRAMRFSPWNTYPTRDGTIVLAVATNDELRALLGVISRLDLAEDATFMNTGWRISNNAQVDAIVSEWTRARTTAEAIAALNAGEVAASPIRDIHDIMAWGHMGERGMLQSVQHPTEALSQRVLGAGFPIKLGRTHKGHVTPAPFLGQHNQEIYGGLLGLPTERIEDLRSRRII